MRRRATGLLLGFLLLPFSAPGAQENGRLEHRVSEVLEAIDSEDVERANAALLPLLAEKPQEPAVRLTAGILRFHEQKYEEAISLLTSSSPRDPSGYLALSKAALEVTRDDSHEQSAHFLIFHPSGKDEVLVPYLEDTLEKQRAVLKEALGLAPEGRLSVEIVDTPRDLARLCTLTEEEIRTSGTVAVAKFNKLMLLSPKALLKGYDWLDTAAHEYTHIILTQKSRNRAPLWLQEGLAKWYEAAWRGGGQPVSPFSAALVKQAITKDRLVTFEEMNPSFAKLPSQERAALAYAQVVMAVEQMVKSKGAAVVPKILDSLAQGTRTETAVASAMGEPFGRFLAEWKSYMSTRPLPKGGLHELERLRFRDDPKQSASEFTEWSEIGDERARGFARLGEIFRAHGRWTAAKIEYAKAYERVGGKVPILANQYALAAAMSGSRDEAEKVLGEALEWSPDYPALNVRLARILMDEGNAKGARDHLLRANAQDPFDPEVHAGLAKALEALGDGAGASREAEFSRILSGRGP